MVKQISVIFVLILIFSCKKSDEKTCFKSFGSETKKVISIDSVQEFRLYKNLTYHLYQDTLKEVIIKGGKNVINFIEIENAEKIVSISNKNKCNFMRDFDKKILVEIHYPEYSKIYSECNDSLLFMNTIISPYLYVEQAEGGGGIRLDVQGGNLVMISSLGVGNYEVSGSVNHADLRVQRDGTGDARKLKASSFEIYQNSTGDLKVNLDSASADVIIKGTGNVIYDGAPTMVSVQKIGDGELIKE